MWISDNIFNYYFSILQNFYTNNFYCTSFFKKKIETNKINVKWFKKFKNHLYLFILMVN
jgi:uncharacterized protein (DUF608 family)